MQKYDIGIISSFRFMVPTYIIDNFNIGIFVVHPSLLPKYRGAWPIQHTLLNGDYETGVSLITASKLKFDAGKIVSQSHYNIHEHDTYANLRYELASKGGKLVAEMLQTDVKRTIENAAEQDENLVTPAPLFKGEEYLALDFQKLTSDKLLKTYKAFTGSSATPSSKMTI